MKESIERNNLDRKRKYLAYKGSTYKDNNIIVQVEDYKNSNLFLSISNLSNSLIKKPRLSTCKTIINELGGEECLWMSNDIGMVDQYGNRFIVYGHSDLSFRASLVHSI